MSNNLRTLGPVVALIVILLACIAGPVSAGTKTQVAQPDRPRIAVILDDLGYNRHAGERALNIKERLTYAIIPYTPYSKQLAQAAFASQREVILHLPMAGSYTKQDLDKGGINLSQSESEVRQRVDQAFAAIPHIIGFNNHMGSQVTENVQVMHWVMQQAKQKPVFFIDSRTNPLSVAELTAHLHGIPALKRDVFLDNVQTPEAIAERFNQLLQKARRKGFAIAIGHPYPATLEFLERTLPGLQQQGVELVSVSTLVAQHGLPQLPPMDGDKVFDWLVSLPIPQSGRLNFSQQ